MKKLPFTLSACLCLSAITASHGATVLGTGAGALLGGDITDPENDGIDVENTSGTNFNWTSITSTTKAYFSDATGGGVNEGSFDIFDNKVGGGEAKFCCDPAGWSVTIQMPQAYVISHFTATSSNDSPGRDPDVWMIQGSTDGLNWTNIYFHNSDDPTAPGDRLHNHAGNAWTARDQVVRFDGGGADFPTPAAYDWFRFNVDSATGWAGAGGNLALGELELFGNPVPEPSGTLLFGLAGLALSLRRRR